MSHPLYLYLKKLITFSYDFANYDNCRYRRDWYLDIKKLKSLTIGRTYSVREFTDAYSGLYVFEDDNGTTLSLCVEDFMLVGDWITYQRDKKIMALL